MVDNGMFVGFQLEITFLACYYFLLKICTPDKKYLHDVDSFLPMDFMQLYQHHSIQATPNQRFEACGLLPECQPLEARR